MQPFSLLPPRRFSKAGSARRLAGYFASVERGVY
jgi:hypothetical protein